MFDKADGVAPLTINTRTNANAKAPVFTAAAFHYTEEPARITTIQAPAQQQSTPASAMRTRAPSVGMNGHVLAPPAL